MSRSETTGLQVYRGGRKSVAVYNTYADEGRLHFDVFLPTSEARIAGVPREADARALEHAREFLRLLGKPTDKVRVDLCERCHIDDTEAYVGQLWQLPNTEVLIWPLEGCPKPTA